MWCPPTPPHSENDMYVDQSVCFLYDSAVMTEAQLPPVYVKKEKKRRQEHQPSGLPKKKSKVVTEELSQQAAALTNRPPRCVHAHKMRTNNYLRWGVQTRGCPSGSAMYCPLRWCQIVLLVWLTVHSMMVVYSSAF